MSGQRLFFAAWPDPALRARAAGLVARLRPVGRPLPPAGYHLTLRFLGETSPALRPAVEALGARVAAQAQPLSLRLDTLEWWEQPRVRVLGASRVPAPWQALVRTLEAGVRDLGFPPEDRAFRPHLSIARGVAEAPPSESAPALDWTADALSLCASAGGEYRCVAQWRFAHGPEVGAAPVE